MRHSSRPHAMDRDGAAAGEFLASLAAAVPAGFWSAPAVVACSGGADSVALLLGLAGLAPPDASRNLVVVHAEHDLRPAAAHDREFVHDLANRLGLRFVWRRVEARAPGNGPRGEGVEARARRLRYGFLADVARGTGARHVAVAHTADDQAETILHRMLRGTGLGGLGGMRAARALCDGVALVRPLLRLPRAEVRGFLVAEGEAWREDESNADTRPARNFLRHEVLPRVTQGPFPAAADSLVRLGRQAELVAGALASAADHLLDVHAARQSDGTVIVRTAALATLDPHLVAEVFATLWRREDWPRRDMTARHYGAVARLVRGGGTAADFPGGVRVEPEGDARLRLRPVSVPSRGPCSRPGT